MTASKLLDPQLYWRGQALPALSRWFYLGLGFLALVVQRNNPSVHARWALGVGIAYAVYNLASQVLLSRRPDSRPLKIAHDIVDAAAVGLGAAFSGGLASPVWHLFYLHVVAVSVRGGLGYAMAIGCLDAAIVAALARSTPEPWGVLNVLTLLWCAFLGGTMSSHLHAARRRLTSANEQLASQNEQLLATLDAHETARRGQETAVGRLRASEERYARLVERIQDGVVILQSDGTIAYANGAFAAMVGVGADSLSGTDFRDLVPPLARPDLADRFARWQQGEPVAGDLDSQLRTRDGATLLVSLRAGTVQFEGRRSVITTVRDVTRQREMEADLKAHAERLAAINEIANAVNLSLTLEDVLGVAAEEARRLVPFDRLGIALLSEEDDHIDVLAVGAGTRRQRAAFVREDVAWAFRRPMAWCYGGEGPPPHLVQGLLSGGGIQAMATVPLVSKDRVIGSMNLGRLQATPFTPADLAVMESVARHIAIALDNARLFEAVRRRSREFESLLQIGRGVVERLQLSELLPLVTSSVNQIMGTHLCGLLLREGNELRLAAQEGLAPETIKAFARLYLGEGFSGWVALHGKPLAVSDIRKDPRAKFADLTEGLGYRSLLCVPLRRGSECLGTLEVLTKEVRHFSAEEQELMAAFADQAAVAIENARLFEEARSNLAKSEEANRRLEDLDRLRQQYLRNVSHEFRSPLTVIKGYAEYLRESGAADDDSLRDVMRTIVESCDRLIDLVDTLIEVSRIEQGTAHDALQLQTVDLRSLAESSLDTLKAAAEKKGVSLCVDFPDAALKVEGDAALLLQMLRKLVDNALKYSSAGGRVVVRGRPEPDGAALEVEDSGIGIAAEHVPQIFEKFYTVDGSLTRSAGGTGVGLYLVREIVKLHGGVLGVRSAPGEGSVFSVRLPRHVHAAPEQAFA